jgi:Ketopantoate reductase PanE/ApbA/Amidase
LGVSKVIEPILIWGAGAIGGTTGAYFAKAGHEVVFLDNAADHVEAINARGLSIESPIAEFGVKARAFTPETLEGKFGTVFLCVKAHHTLEAARALEPYLTSDGVVVSAQNGLNELEIASVVGESRTVSDTALLLKSIPEIAAMYRNKELSPLELTRLTLERVGQLNPILKAFITVTSEKVLAQAARTERELASGIDLGLLHGIPIALKDLVVGFAVSAATHVRAQQYRRHLTLQFLEVLGGVNAILSPTVAFVAPFEDPVFAADDAGATEVRRTAPYNLAGLPALSVMGFWCSWASCGHSDRQTTL